MRGRRGIGAMACAVLWALAPSPSNAQTPPTGFVVENGIPSAAFQLPVQLVFLPGGRKLVVEKAGAVWVVDASGTKLGAPFIDLSPRVLSNGDRGLLGVALDPDFAANRWVYFLYTVDPDSNSIDNNLDGYSRLERYRTSLSDPNRIDLTTRQVLIGTDWPSGIPCPGHEGSHTIGAIEFGADGTLLLSSGDAAHFSATDPGGLDASAFGPGRTDPSEDIGAFRAQSVNSMCGKILRVDKETGHGLPSNPWWDGNPVSARSRVWLYGLRNAFRFCVRPGTGSSFPVDGAPGTLLVGDVGWGTWEELDVATHGGLNLGWPCIEGPVTTMYTSVPQPPGISCGTYGSTIDPAAPTGPQRWWSHFAASASNPPGALASAIVGGTWYSGTGYPSAYRDRLFFADYPRGWIKTAQLDAAGNVTSVQDFINSGAVTPVDLETDPATGDIWYVSIASGTVKHIRFASGNHDPVAAANVGPLYGLAPLAVTFDAGASSDADHDALTYVWRFGDGDSALTPFATHAYTANGTYAAQVEVRDTHGGVDRRTFTLIVGQLPPAVSIVQPADGSFAVPGQAIALEAAAVDTSAGPVNYRWEIDVGPADDMVLSRVSALGRLATFPFQDLATAAPYADRVRLIVTQGPFTVIDTVRVLPRANAAAGAAAATPLRPHAGRPFEVALRVRSTDVLSLPEIDVTAFEGAAALASAHVAAIAPGDSAQAILSLPALAAGDHLLRLVVDPANAFAETDESDDETDLIVHVRATGEPFAEWRAHVASGTGPYADGSTTSLWRDVASAYDALLPSANAPRWRGDGSLASPERLEFAAANDPVTLAAPDAVRELAVAGPVSAEVWLRTGSDVVRPQTVLEWFAADSAPWLGLALGIDAGHLRAWGSPWRACADLEPLHWYHLVLEEAADSLRLYVNGVAAYADGAPLPGAQHSALKLGASQRGGVLAERFEGAIGAVRLYDDALDPVQVRTAFLADSVRFLGPSELAATDAIVLAAEQATGSAPPAVPGSASPWHDVSGGGHDGELEGVAAASDTSGWAGAPENGSPWRLELDGVDDVVRVTPGSVTALQSPTSASVALWFRAASTSAEEQGLIEWQAGDVARSGMALELAAGRLRLWTGAGWADVGGATAGVWHHVAVAKTATLARVWLDGRAIWRGFSPALGSQASALVVGALLPVVSDPPQSHFRGAIGRVEVARGAFTDADVAARYAAQAAPYLHVLAAATPAPTCLGGARTTVQVPVRLARAGTSGVLGFSVTLQWSGELARAGAVEEGEFLTGTAPTFLQVVDGPDRTVTVDCVRLGAGCSAPAQGDLFRISFSAAVGAGTGIVKVLSASLRDCTNQPQEVDLGEAVTIPIDGSGPGAVSGLTATAVDVPGSATRAVRLSFVAPADAESVTVYRAPFGGYPEYDDVAGTGVPSSEPPSAPWERTGVHDSGHTDLAATRDEWSYVAYAWDACGNRSLASVVTPASVNYVLGDARGGGPGCAGDGVVDALDLAPLLAHYGTHPANGDSLACLDYGPTVDGRLDARPATDDVLDFEDLMVLALDHSASAPGGSISGTDEMSLSYSAPAAVGDTFTVSLVFRASGQAHGVTTALAWDPAKAAFVSARSGPLLAAQALPSVVVSTDGSRVDAALLGHGAGLTGNAALATLVFRRLTTADPVISIPSVHGRTATNADYVIPVGTTNLGAPPEPPRVLMLSEAIPNPSRAGVVFTLALPRGGAVSLLVYDLQGRRVRTLVDAVLPPGEQRVLWDGRDGAGRTASPGVYFARLMTSMGVRTRRVVRIH